MNGDKQRRIVASVVLLVALVFVVAGAARTHRVYGMDGNEFGLLTFDRIREGELVVDSTFTGVARRDGRLHSTYDRTVERGKRTCPT
ncbi:MAG: hypothetical protein BWY59_01712 [Verrucomicrobia bacterium ADurb.Bin345]|nr:MAG: hypothetical protein BWY59_01712 [Verrucomicrobia bacterium ADurb.Bin345]